MYTELTISYTWIFSCRGLLCLTLALFKGQVCLCFGKFCFIFLTSLLFHAEM